MTIVLRDIYKKYEKLVVLDFNFLEINEGYSYMLLGENGSGKSTLIKMILNHTKYEGKITNTFRTISYIPERVNLPLFMKVREFLENIIMIRGVKTFDLDYLLEYFELKVKEKQVIKNLSKGMRQKLILITGLALDVDLYILDEALNGLDKKMQDKLLKYLEELKTKGKTIIYTTHYEKYFTNFSDYIIRLEDHKVYVSKNQTSS